MRLEAIEKEADLFKGDTEAYVHMEKVTGKDMKVVVNGGRAGLSLAAYVLIQHVSEEIGTSVPHLLRFYKKMYRKHGMLEKTDE